MNMMDDSSIFVLLFQIMQLTKYQAIRRMDERTGRGNRDHTAIYDGCIKKDGRSGLRSQETGS